MIDVNDDATKSTVMAISQLCAEYPYAATLLIYVLAERVFKGYLLEHWRDPEYACVQLPEERESLQSYQGKCLGELSTLPHETFLNQVVCRLTLGDVEERLKKVEKRLNKKGSIAGDRNEVMHSTLYLKGKEADMSEDERKEKNIVRLNKAKDNLKYVFDQLTDCELVGWKLVTRATSGSINRSSQGFHSSSKKRLE